VFAVITLDGSGNYVRNVATSLGLRDSDTSTLFSGEKVGEKSLLQFFAAEFDNGWNSKGKASVQRASGATQT
jgi:hypothetical protein